MKKSSSAAIRPRKKEGLSPWLVALLVLVVLSMNYQIVTRSQQAEMTADIKRMTSVQNDAEESEHKVETPSSPTKPPPILRLPIPPRPENPPKNLVKEGDFIYYNEDENYPLWDAAPVVIESHKLLFFTIPKVGCTVWKQLFRRMMGYPDWKSQDYEKYLPHNPAENGLKYLYHYSLEEANEMMTSANWTRAIMVRDPKMRFLSAFLDKSVSNDHKHIIQRCCPDKSCVWDAQTIPGFLRLVQVCDDGHWKAQNERVDHKFWSYIDFVSHVETAAQDAETLLRKIGAWEEFGASGWGEDEQQAIFESTGAKGAGSHATWSQHKVWQWYNPESEELVERFYQADYTNPLFEFERGNCLTCIEDDNDD